MQKNKNRTSLPVFPSIPLYIMKTTSYLDFIAQLLTNEDEFSAFKACYQQTIPKSIKLINSKAKKADLLPYFTDQGRQLEYPDLSDWNKKYDDVCYVHNYHTKTLGTHFLHQWGFFYIQEVAAGLSAQVLNPEKWDLVLDLCASPWGKTIQLADKLLSSWEGFVLANEPSNSRRKALIFNINRCGMLNTAISAYKGEDIGDLAPETFDKVLVDAPCSGEGMQYKHDKKVQMRDQKAADKLAKLQTQLLLSGIKALKVWWTLVYSTCTLNPFENEGVISQVINKIWPAIELMSVPIEQKSNGISEFQDKTFLSTDDTQKVARFRPHIQHTWGFFILKLKKVASIETENKQDKRTLKESQLYTWPELEKKVRDYLDHHRGICKQANTTFISTNNAIYCTTKDYSNLSKKLHTEKIWLPIIKIGYSGERIPQQSIATCFWSSAKKNTQDLSNQQAQELSENNLLREQFWKPWEFLVLKRQWKGFALGKQGENIIKSKIN